MGGFATRFLGAVIRLQPLASFWGGRGNAHSVRLRVLIDDAPKTRLANEPK